MISHSENTAPFPVSVGKGVTPLDVQLEELSLNLARRNTTVKELRSTLAKTEEERDQYWKELQECTREKKAVVVRLQQTESNFEDLSSKYKQSESARKALSRSLSKAKGDVNESSVTFSTPGTPISRVQNVKPPLPPSPRVPSSPTSNVSGSSIVSHLRCKLTNLSTELEKSRISLSELEEKLCDEQTKRKELKSAFRAKVDRFEIARMEFSSALINERMQKESAEARAAEALEISSRSESLAIDKNKENGELRSIIEELEVRVAELEEFKKKAMKEWMLQSMKQL